MTFGARLLVLVALTVTVSVATVTWVVSTRARRAFESLDDQRTEALISQFRREFASRGDEVVRRVEGIARSEAALRIAIELSRPGPDYSQFVNEAASLAQAHGLDFLELVSHDGAIVSSAHWPARYGYKADWVLEQADWNEAFLRSEELPNETALALMTVRTVSAGEKKLHIAGGKRLGQEFLNSLVLPAGMRALLYHNKQPGFDEKSLTGALTPGKARRPSRRFRSRDVKRSCSAFSLWGAPEESWPRWSGGSGRPAWLPAELAFCLESF